jgi:hypothetical protein
MKKLIVIAGLFLVSIFSAHAQGECDTLKLKIIQTNYGLAAAEVFNTIGDLDNAVINIDTLFFFHPEIFLVNISDETFKSNETYRVEIFYSAHADTGLLMWNDIGISFNIGMALLSNDTVKIGFAEDIDLLKIIDELKEVRGIDFEEISYWRMVAGIGATSKDGVYSNSVFYAGADTSVFYVVKGDVGIQEMEKETNLISVYPNPARSQFTVTNTENASLQLYNMLGQEVLRTYSKEANTLVNVDFVPQGMYVLKIVKNGISSTHKIAINNSKY